MVTDLLRRVDVDHGNADLWVWPQEPLNNWSLEGIHSRLQLSVIKTVRREERYGRVDEVLSVQKAERVALSGQS